jgi:hypothetical protein
MPADPAFLVLAANWWLAMTGENIDLTDDFSRGDCHDKDTSPTGRRFVGIHFTCCDVYTRIYVNRDATAYEGNCPKCARRVRLRIGPGGTSARFFTAG